MALTNDEFQKIITKMIDSVFEKNYKDTKKALKEYAKKTETVKKA